MFGISDRVSGRGKTRGRQGGIKCDPPAITKKVTAGAILLLLLVHPGIFCLCFCF